MYRMIVKEFNLFLPCVDKYVNCIPYWIPYIYIIYSVIYLEKMSHFLHQDYFIFSVNMAVLNKYYKPHKVFMLQN